MKEGKSNITQKWKITQKLLECRKWISREDRQAYLDTMLAEDTSDTSKNKKITCVNLLEEDGERR